MTSINFKIILPLIALICQAAQGSPLTPGSKNAVPTKFSAHPLIVVHATTEFDEEMTAAKGVDEVVAQFKAQRRPVVYLVSDQSKTGYQEWYTKDRKPDFELFSEGGEHNLPLAMDEVTIVGGFFGSYDGARGCQTLATRDAIAMHFENTKRPFTIHMPLKAIYFYEEDAVTRENILNLDTRSATSSQIKKVFKDFASLFFLTANLGPGIEFGHPYFRDSNPFYRAVQPVNMDNYTFRLFLNDRPVAKPFGHGPRQVALKLENI
ncbi:MAG TPA: hypothetical protein DCS07_09865 [Bdellovibrionales bacterium]|nr:MAG: hypothetical protein A2Z97_08090 [Bdellovibrionales bacterium GWB1_52_6]OFZ03808.1 MAG: hypothetical protein A2X97_15530 [Bdellovibrionales bacterium GWA1_52_35]OFZ36863.1 MAG: hypothetical protein A2070_00260 [Bdellovibrionales bacterium GWC1_52_8]HAR42918.1 hypothetical protein [Bdellovibrionales bacterium]HCM40911.1 hypothetical protein [Bdellovibrionales bacterium]